MYNTKELSEKTQLVSLPSLQRDPEIRYRSLSHRVSKISLKQHPLGNSEKDLNSIQESPKSKSFVKSRYISITSLETSQSHEKLLHMILPLNQCQHYTNFKLNKVKTS